MTEGGLVWGRKCAVGFAFFAATLLFSVRLRAEEPPPTPAPPPITPPSVMDRTEPDYPNEAHGDARVVLGVTVNADGSIRALRVIEGEEPFLSRAKEAVARWRFSPGRRGEQPIATIVRVEVLFTAPRVAEAPVAVPTEAAPLRNANEPKVDEVVVRGAVEDVPKTQSIGKAEVRLLPGAFGDPFRAVESLPGVTPIVSGLPYFFVRGAPPGDVGYLIDGMRVPYLYHFGLGPAVVHPALIDRVDLHSGAYPASFGRFAGGIVSSTTTRPHDAATGEASIRLVDAGAFVEAPFANGKAHALVAGRYSYTAALLSLASPDTSVDYRDYQARFVYEPTPKDTITFFTFGAYDFASQVKTNGTTETLFDSQFYRFDLRYDRVLGPESKLSAALTLGYDESKLQGAEFAGDLMLGGRTSFSHRFSSELELRGGFDTYVDHYSTGLPRQQDLTDSQYSDQLAIFLPRNDVVSGVFSEAAVRLSRRVDMAFGLRADRFESAGQNALSLDPRLRANVGLSDRVRLLLASGLAHQGPSFVVPIPGIGIAGLKGGLQRAYQSSAGVEVDIEKVGTVSGTGFHQEFARMNDVIGASGSGNDIGEDASITDRTKGYALGLEIAFKRKMSNRVGAFLSYTLSRSVRWQEGERRLAAFDRTHVLNTGITFDLGLGWNAGTRFVYYTGRPIDNVTRSPETFGPDRLLNSAFWRLPAYYRFDARLEKRWKLGTKGWISFVVEGLNVTLNKEHVSGSCVNGRCTSEAIGPVAVPSLGVEGGF